MAERGLPAWAAYELGQLELLWGLTFCAKCWCVLPIPETLSKLPNVYCPTCSVNELGRLHKSKEV